MILLFIFIIFALLDSTDYNLIMNVRYVIRMYLIHYFHEVMKILQDKIESKYF